MLFLSVFVIGFVNNLFLFLVFVFVLNLVVLAFVMSSVDVASFARSRFCLVCCLGVFFLCLVFCLVILVIC